MRFESLANELLLDIFEFLTCSQLLHAFIGLNTRLNNLLLTHIQNHWLDFRSIYKHDFDTVCQHYLPSIINRITSVRLSNDKETPQQIHLFYKYNLTLRQFSNLQTLSLCNILDEEKLISLMLECYHIPYLTHLKLIGFSFQSSQTHFRNFITSIWNLPKLIYCKLDASLTYGKYTLEPTVISTSIKQLILSGLEPCVNPLTYLFDYTPYLQNFSLSSLTLRTNFMVPTHLIPSLTKLDVCFITPTTPYMIEYFLEMMSNLYKLTVSIRHINMNGHMWEQIIKNHLPKLEIFQLKMEITIRDINNKEREVDTLIDSFRNPFWLEEHQWFVRCDWIPQKPYTILILYTLPYSFPSFDFNVPILFKTTSPHINHNYSSYKAIKKLRCDTSLSGELTQCNVYFSNIEYLSIKLPINDQLWSIIPQFDQLISLSVILDHENDLGQSQLHFLLNRAPRLRSLKLKSCLSSTEQVLLTVDNNTNVSNLQLFSQGYSQCFYHQTCISLSNSVLGRQCQVLEIAVNDRTNIITLINQMTKLRALYVYCRDDKHTDESDKSNDELIEWLQQHLPSTCTIIRNECLFYIIKIWIR